MIKVESIKKMQELSSQARVAGQRVSIVPTMGYLHEGHLSLIRKARELSDFVIVSLFVNPTQFGPDEDFEDYPRDFDRDYELCLSEGADVLFVPSAGEVYSEACSTYVDETSLSGGLCGKSRSGHFRGVVTVVAKLFNMTLPDIAVFGQKDAQQVRVIKRMVTDLNFPVEVIVAPIVREPDGLAMSSRNTYLSKDERQSALSLYEAISLAECKFSDGERSVEVLRGYMADIFASHSDVDVEYIELVDNVTLEPVEKLNGDTLVALAVRIGKTRLIDNTVLLSKG